MNKKESRFTILFEWCILCTQGRKGGDTMSLIIIILLVAIYVGYEGFKAIEPHAPAVKDWDKFNRDTIGMDAKEIKNGLRSGRW